MDAKGLSHLPTSALSAALVFVRERSGTIRYWSDGLQQLDGYSAEQALGQDAHQLLQTSFPALPEAIAAAVESSGTWSGELLQRRKDGLPVVVLSQWSLTRDEGETFVTETCNDISVHRQRADYLAAIVQSTDDAIVG